VTTEKSLDKSEMEKKENIGINSETRQIGVLKGFDEQHIPPPPTISNRSKHKPPPQ